MLFDKNGEVVSYDESDIFCDDLMRADEHIDPSYYINYVGIQSEKSNKTRDRLSKSKHGRDNSK